MRTLQKNYKQTPLTQFIPIQYSPSLLTQHYAITEKEKERKRKVHQDHLLLPKYY